MRFFRMLFCRHWFLPNGTETFTERYGAFVCGDIKSDSVTVEKRKCCRCGLEDKREINREYQGWNGAFRPLTKSADDVAPEPPPSPRKK